MYNNWLNLLRCVLCGLVRDTAEGLSHRIQLLHEKSRFSVLKLLYTKTGLGTQPCLKTSKDLWVRLEKVQHFMIWFRVGPKATNLAIKWNIYMKYSNWLLIAYKVFLIASSQCKLLGLCKLVKLLERRIFSRSVDMDFRSKARSLRESLWK